jgi:toxin ParE1/3/4
MSRIIRSNRARRDVVEIGIYIGERNLAAAKRFRKAVTAACRKLADVPYLGSECESDNPRLHGLRTWTLRKFPNHVILYRPLPDGIEVVRVIHGSRDMDTLILS